MPKEGEVVTPEEEARAKKSNALAEKVAATFAIAGYAICSSTMLVCNKVTVHFLPSPSFVLFGQLASAALTVWTCGVLGYVEVEELNQKRVLGFAPVAIAFLGVIFANIKTLQYANVETFIVFRASTPIIVSLCDYAFLGRQLPDALSWLSLLGLLAGTVGYVYYDATFEVRGT